MRTPTGADWSAYADLAKYRTEFQRVSLALPRRLVERKIALLGVQSPFGASLSDREEFTTAPGIVLDAEIAVASVANLEALTQDEVTL